MTNEEIEKRIEKLDKLAEDNYRSFQDSGIQRYYRTYTKYSEEADLYRRILTQNEEHNKYVHLRAAVARAVGAYRKIQHEDSAQQYEKMRKILRELEIEANV